MPFKDFLYTFILTAKDFPSDEIGSTVDVLLKENKSV